MTICSKKRVWALGLGLVVFSVAAWSHAAVSTNDSKSLAQATEPAPLNRVRLIKALSSDQADQRRKVRLTAVVTFCDPAWNLLMVADRTGGIFVTPSNRVSGISFGQQVVVEGVTGAGGFAPVIQEAQLTPGIRTDLPSARQLSEMDVLTGRLDNEWVEVRGIILSTRTAAGHALFRLATRFGVLSGTIPQPWTEETARQLTDATVQIQAVCGSASNQKRQFTGAHLWVPDLTCIRVVEPPLLDPFSLPSQPISSLMQYDAHRGLGSRVRLQGVVTLQASGELLYLQDSSDGTRVRTRGNVSVVPGDVIDAVGYPAIDGYSPSLQDAVVRKIGATNQPVIAHSQMDRLSRGAYDGALIKIKARLLEKTRRQNATLLALQSEDHYFEARLDQGGEQLEQLRDGSELELVGVCDVKINEQHEPSAFVLLLRTAKDVRVLAAPYWWTPERASSALGLTSIIILIAMTWVSMLRRRVAMQTEQIRKSLEQEAALEHRYRNLFESAHDFIFTCDEQGRFTSFNHSGSRLTELSQQEALSKTIFDLTSPANHPLLKNLLTPSGENGASPRQELELMTKSGRRMTVDLTLTYLARSGTSREVQGIARDITEQKRMEREVLEARDLAVEGARQKAEFLANMSHEIRTPMNGVIGMTNLLLGTPLNPQQTDFTETIRNSAEALLIVVNDILDFSKIEAGKLAVETLDFDLRDAVESSLELLATRAAAKGLELACSLDLDAPTALRGDPMRLRQILTNLVGNAVKFTDHGEVVLRVRKVQESSDCAVLRFEVQDTGIGIPEAAQARLFQPFNQADGSNARRFGGTGLGLAISKQLVELMQGKIGLESKPGKGSTFWFTIEFAKQTAPQECSSVPLSDWTSVRVLIVDDNESNRQILEHQVNSWRLQSSTASSGEAALELLRREASQGRPYSIALLDLQMPGMDGLTLAHAIKADPFIAETRLVILSSLGHPLSESEVQKAGISACLLKPVKQSRLFDCLATAMGTSASSSKVETSTAAPLSRIPAESLRLLLAEDNAVNQKVAMGQLQRLGYHADIATNGLQVLEALERKTYDVILMDCQMPELDGYETTQRIRQQEQAQGGRARRLHIIAMTAHAMKGDREKCLASGMDDYISKPIRTQELGDALAKCPAPPPMEQETSPSLTSAEPLSSFTAGQRPGPLTNSPVETKPAVDMERLLEAVGGIEEEAQALAVFYLEQAREMLERLEKAAAVADLTEIEHVAHKLAGASASCGASSLLPTLRELEHSARAGDLPAAKAAVLYEQTREQFQEVERCLATSFTNVPAA